MNKIANRVASRFKQAYLSMKIPVNYAFVINCKKLLSDQGVEVKDEDLQQILSRYMDLVIYGLCNGTAPSQNDLITIAQDFSTEYNDSDEFEFEDSGYYEQEDRF